jgi:hypothetical protein
MAVEMPTLAFVVRDSVTGVELESACDAHRMAAAASALRGADGRQRSIAPAA